MLDQKFLQALTWWENSKNLTQGATLHPEKPSITILTDASQKRWGGHLADQDSSLTHQETGRNTFLIPIPPDAKIIPVVNTRSSHTESKIHPRSPECNGRPSESQRSSSQSRMDLVKTGIQTDILCFSKSPSRSIYGISQSSTSFVCEPISRQGSLANRCSDNKLGEHKRICFSSHNNHRPSSEDGRRDRLYNSPNSPILAQPTMVSIPSKLVGRISNNADSQQKTTESTKLKCIPFQARESQTSRVDSIKARLLSEEFSEEVAEMASKPQRKSSLSVYQSHFNSFTDWLKTRNTNLESVSVQDVADYLLYMFKTLGHQVARICNHSTALSAALGEMNGFTVGNHPIITNLINSFWVERPQLRLEIPDLDLNYVLSKLIKAPFEPPKFDTMEQHKLTS